ncbi:hypothetical protein [Micromonospora wenchangensis]|uniref:hypothetical protein n=1 Tax=Micromonospora wenchangensis TaxID=1185415 RepID=UPI003D707597
MQDRTDVHLDWRLGVPVRDQFHAVLLVWVAGSAVDYARLVDPARIISPERRARDWEDTALALRGRGRPQATFQALLAAERDTPQEVRFRPWAQQLTTDLLSRNSHSLPNIRGLGLSNERCNSGC